MKIIYTILFFVDTLALVALDFLFLKLIDNGTDGLSLFLMLTAILSCIGLLVFLLYRYSKIPPPNRHNKY